MTGPATLNGDACTALPATRRRSERSVHTGRVDDARRLWTLVEPFHAIVYFAPEVSSAFEGIGLRGFWRGYFAGRAAPLGAVGPGVVSACFFGFRPDFVARAIPSIWSIATPDQALEARLAGVEAALEHLVDIQSRRAEIVEAATLIRAGLQGCSVAGRPMFGANADLAWPSEPHLALWHATTLVREHRGDAHVAALSVAGLNPCEAHVTQIAASGVSPETVKPYRGWSDQEWRHATLRLAGRGLLDDTGRLTEQGHAARDGVERDTDRLASAAISHLDSGEVVRLLELLAAVVAPVVESGTIPYPNAMGVPRPSE